MTITRNQVTTVMLMIVLWIVVAWWLVGCDRTIYVSNLDDAYATESTPSATPTLYEYDENGVETSDPYLEENHMTWGSFGTKEHPATCFTSDNHGKTVPCKGWNKDGTTPTNQLPTSIEER